jgi:hypothetical protein
MDRVVDDGMMCSAALSSLVVHNNVVLAVVRMSLGWSILNATSHVELQEENEYQ